MSVQKKGRTLGITVDDLLTSQRFKLAVENFDMDPMFMKAILIELGFESMEVAKHKIISTYNRHSALDQFEMTPLLKSVNEFNSFNIWWKLTPEEQKLYVVDPKRKMSKSERRKAFEKVRKMFMESNSK